MLTLVVNNKFNDYGIHESKLSILFYKFVLQYNIKTRERSSTLGVPTPTRAAASLSPPHHIMGSIRFAHSPYSIPKLFLLKFSSR